MSMTMEELHRQNDALKQEADKLLVGKGLMRILEAYGRPYVTGSYDLDTMTWRDLDLYLEMETCSEERI